MKLTPKIAVVAVFMSANLTVPAAAQVQAAAPKKLFSCSLGKKIAEITAVDGEMTYQVRTSAKVEIAITGSAARGNLFYRSDRYAGMEYQVRFVSGPYSYIVYSMEGNGHTGAHPVSGVVVMKGKERIADMSCFPHAEFSTAFDFDRLPEDDEAYSAM